MNDFLKIISSMCDASTQSPSYPVTKLSQLSLDDVVQKFFSSLTFVMTVLLETFSVHGILSSPSTAYVLCILWS